MIYFVLVNPQTAQFNINIDYRTYSDLSSMFKGLEFVSSDGGESKSSDSITENLVTPWSDVECSSRSDEETGSRSGTGSISISQTQSAMALEFLKLEIPARLSTSSDDSDEQRSLSPFPLYAPSGIQVPDGFSFRVFDKAYDIVKQDVFRNTWVRYEAIFGRPRSVTEFALGRGIEQLTGEGPRAGERGPDQVNGWSASWRSLEKAASWAMAN